MATATAKPISSLAAALAQSSIHSKVRDAGHPVYSQSLPQHKRRSALPTPPNSLSPTLPPQKGRSGSLATAMSPVPMGDSDIDSMENQEATLPLSSAALSGIDAADAITPAMLAKHHLPGILLQNGPLAMRFILGHLTQTVPGFARIPPAKARRICVAALESRGGGGLDGEIVFEKIGWGRWDARHQDDPPREPTEEDENEDLLSASVSIPYGTRQQTGRRGKTRGYMTSPMLSPNVQDFPEHEADAMSLDGDEPIEPTPEPSRAIRRVPIVHPPSDEDMTDEEDWESMGPENLMVGSYEPSFASRRGSHVSSIGRPNIRLSESGPMRPPLRHMSLSGPAVEKVRNVGYSGGILPFQRVYSTSHTSSRMLGVQRSVPGPRQRIGESPQEREAIEALLRMGKI